MKNSTWQTVIKVIIAVASALLGALPPPQRRHSDTGAARGSLTNRKTQAPAAKLPVHSRARSARGGGRPLGPRACKKLTFEAGKGAYLGKYL